MVWMIALFASLAIAARYTLPVREAGLSAQNVEQVSLALAAFALAGFCLGRVGLSLRNAIDAQAAALVLGFYATVVSATLHVHAADRIELVLGGAFAAMAGGAFGAAIAQFVRSTSKAPVVKSDPVGWRPIGG